MYISRGFRQELGNQRIVSGAHIKRNFSVQKFIFFAKSLVNLVCFRIFEDFWNPLIFSSFTIVKPTSMQNVRILKNREVFSNREVFLKRNPFSEKIVCFAKSSR